MCNDFHRGKYGSLVKRPFPKRHPGREIFLASALAYGGLSLEVDFRRRHTQALAAIVARETPSTATQLGLPSTFAMISTRFGRLLGWYAA